MISRPKHTTFDLVDDVTNQVLEEAAPRVFKDGCVVQSLATGGRYRLEHVRPGRVATMVREVPKVKGKAARKAAKRARRAAREERGW